MFFMGHSVEKTKSHVVSADKETTVPSLYSAFAINSNWSHDTCQFNELQNVVIYKYYSWMKANHW